MKTEGHRSLRVSPSSKKPIKRDQRLLLVLLATHALHHGWAGRARKYLASWLPLSHLNYSISRGRGGITIQKVSAPLVSRKDKERNSLSLPSAILIGTKLRKISGRQMRWRMEELSLGRLDGEILIFMMLILSRFNESLVSLSSWKEMRNFQLLL